MENYFTKALSKLDTSALTVTPKQDSLSISSFSLLKIKSLLPTIKHNSKKCLTTFTKHFSLLENFVKKLKMQKMKLKYDQEKDLTDYKIIIKKHKEEAKLRREIINLEEDEFRFKIMKEAAEKKQKEEIELENALQKKKELILSLKEKASYRRKEISMQKKIILESNSLAKPKYLEMEQRYKSVFEAPELERRKAELAKKRMVFQPISHKEWVGHLKKYNEKSLQAEKKRMEKGIIDCPMENKEIANVLRRAQVMESQDRLNAKKEMADKRKKYAEQVRLVNVSKNENKIEVAEGKIQEKKEIPTEKNKILTEKKEIPTENKLVFIIPEVEKKKKKNRQNPAKKIESKTPDISPDCKADYLSVLRQKRLNFEESSSLDMALTSFQSISLSEDKSKLLKKLQNYEKIAKSQERKMKITAPNSLFRLDLEEKINSLLTQSIQTKLSLIVQ